MKAIDLGVLALVDGLSSGISTVLTVVHFEKRHNVRDEPRRSDYLDLSHDDTRAVGSIALLGAVARSSGPSTPYGGEREHPNRCEEYGAYAVRPHETCIEGLGKALSLHLILRDGRKWRDGDECDAKTDNCRHRAPRHIGMWKPAGQGKGKRFDQCERGYARFD